MKAIKQLGRGLAIFIAVLVIVVSLAGIAGFWWLNNGLTNLTNQLFLVASSGVAIADVGVARADELVGNGRAEVQNASDTVTTVGENIQANNPVLTALFDRVNTRLGPTIDQIQTTLEPVAGALRNTDQVLGVLVTVGLINEDTPRLLTLQESVSGLTQLTADVQQMRGTLEAMATGRADQVTAEAVSVLTGIATRIDTRLGDLQANIQQLRSDISALQTQLAERQARILRTINLATLALTLLFLWVIYSQTVVIRSQWQAMRGGSAATTAPQLETADEAPSLPPASGKALEAAEDQ